MPRSDRGLASHSARDLQPSIPGPSLTRNQVKLRDQSDPTQREPAREQRLLVSLGEHGQQTPVWVTATEEAGRWVLIDGYARVRALQALARDWAEARVMEVSEAEALLRSFGLDNTRPRSALEEGWMLRALRDEHGLRQQELATRLDRSESWVSRRLDLVRVLPNAEALLDEVRDHRATRRPRRGRPRHRELLGPVAG